MAASGDESREAEDLVRAHKREVRQLEDQKRVQLKRASKKDQSKVQVEFAQKLDALQSKHASELAAFQANSKSDQAAGYHGGETPPPLPLPGQTAVSELSNELGGFSFEVRSTGGGRANARRQKKQAQERARRAELDELNAQLVDHKQIEIGAICSQLASQNLSISLIKADGDCLFSSILHQLSLHPHLPQHHSVASLRSLAVEYMRSHPDDYAPFIDDQEAATFGEYLDKMQSTTVWGSQLELQALAHQLKAPIVVYTAELPHRIATELYPEDNALILTFHRHYCALGDHYNSVSKSQ